MKTKNGFGWSSELTNPITDQMLKFIAACTGPRMLDVGCAFGVATLPALRLGASVIANDIEREHLDHIAKLADAESLSQRLRILIGRFPFIDELPAVDAVHCSNVLHFLRGSELAEAIEYVRGALAPDGKLFIQVGTPYAGHVRAFFPQFEERFRDGDSWPGEIENTATHIPKEISAEIPQFLHLLDRKTLSNALSKRGFKIDYAEYYTRPGLPEICRNDGRENLGIVASRR